MLSAIVTARSTRHRHLLTASVALLSAAAWLALWMNGASHAAMHGGASGAMHHHHHGGDMAITPVSPLLSALMFVGGWTLMTVAMMLPTSLPVLTTFLAIAGDRKGRATLVSLVVLGYLIAWSGFGILVHLAQLGLGRLVLASGWVEAHAWMLGGAILIFAGVYQFTPLKYQCLDKCRSPLSFVIEHWRGYNERGQAFRLGIHHGVFCVGCCWALMLLMFVVGTANLVGMLMLGAVMAVEKNTAWGRRLGVPLGTVLLGWGIVTLVVT